MFSLLLAQEVEDEGDLGLVEKFATDASYVCKWTVDDQSLYSAIVPRQCLLCLFWSIIIIPRIQSKRFLILVLINMMNLNSCLIQTIRSNLNEISLYKKSIRCVTYPRLIRVESNNRLPSRPNHQFGILYLKNLIPTLLRGIMSLPCTRTTQSSQHRKTRTIQFLGPVIEKFTQLFQCGGTEVGISRL